jgi:glycosyltransferase involved in cell wall biosynthesis
MSCSGLRVIAFALQDHLVGNPMKILFLTFYYPPDLSAGSFRSEALIEQLVQSLPSDAHIDVITTQPNRYASIDKIASRHEVRDKISVERIPLPAHQSGMIDQARAFITFDRAVTQRVHGRKYDLVFATSSRLMTAFLGARIAARLNTRLYLDIRDIFADTIKDVLPGAKVKLLLPVLNQIERYTVRKAARINLVSEGFRPYFESRYPGQRFDFFTNGIDEEFLDIDIDWSKTNLLPAKPLRVLYAGNIGEGQGLHRILPQLAKMAGQDYIFTVVGDGGRRDQLQQDLSREGVQNAVDIKPPVERGDLMNYYKNSDVLFLHLNDYDAFAKVLPSKIFEYAATGKPIVAGVNGYSAEFLRSEVENCAVFPPCDATAALGALKSVSVISKHRTTFIQRYRRTGIMKRMAESLMKTANSTE